MSELRDRRREAEVPFPDSLCHRCAFCRNVVAARSTFLRCAALPIKYPRQPVEACDAFRPSAPAPARPEHP